MSGKRDPRPQRLWVRIVQRLGQVILAVVTGYLIWDIVEWVRYPLGTLESRQSLRAWQIKSRSNIEPLTLSITMFREGEGHYPRRLSGVWGPYLRSFDVFILSENSHTAFLSLKWDEMDAVAKRFADDRFAKNPAEPHAFIDARPSASRRSPTKPEPAAR